MESIKNLSVEEFYYLDQVGIESDGFYFTDEKTGVSETVPVPSVALLPEDDWNGEDYTDHLHPIYLSTWKELQDKVVEAYENKKERRKQEMKVLKEIRIDNRNWCVELENGHVWNFKRQEFLSFDGNPRYEIYPPYELGLPLNVNIGRRNNKKGCYNSDGYVGLENIGLSNVPKNTDLEYILNKFYNN